MRFANPAGLALLALAIPVLLTHVLRPRRTSMAVPSVLLWRRVERPVSAAQPWQRLRWSLLLLAQLLAVILLALAVARPERLSATPLAEHTVFIVDASGSMAATDGSPDRLAAARERAAELRDELPGGGIASIVVAGDVPRVALTASADGDEFSRALRTVDQSRGRPDFADAFSLAESLETADAPIGFVLLSDGGLAPEDAARLPGGTRVERIGERDVNRSISRLAVERRDGGLHARVTVRNTGGPAVTQPVRLDVDGVTHAAEEVALGAGEQRDVELDVPDGDLVEAFLGGDDLLAADDHAVAVTARRAELRVLLVGDPLFWQEVLTAIPGVTVDLVDADDAAAAPTDGYDLTIYNGVDVPAAPGSPFVAVAPPGGLQLAGERAPSAAPSPTAEGETGSVRVDGTVERPAVTLVRTDDPVLAGLDLADVAVATSQHVTSDAEVLVAGEDAPLLLRGELDGRRYAYLTFALRDSNLPVQLAFPLLADRLVGDLTGTGLAAESLEVGDRLPVPAGAASEVVGPDARRRAVAAGDPAPRATRSGFWRITTEGAAEVVVAVNVPPAESTLAPADVAAPPDSRTAAPDAAKQATPMLPWLLLPLLALVALEAWLAWRRVGVGRRQWRAALAVRAAVAALVVLALIDPALRRSSDRVATVFVVDGSASVGPGGRDTADGFVADAVGGRGKDDLAGVVVFGGDAHVDQVVAAADEYPGASAIVDVTATDVASGLRLGGALLPEDARRRIVLLSDGRVNSGDIGDEIEVLAAAGVPVDIVTLEPAGGPDVAVAEVAVPRRARPGDRIPVDVHLDAAVATPATVTLRRDGVEIGSQSVDLAVGENTVSFDDTGPSDAGAVLRYQAVVTSPGDTVAENDAGFAALPVDGPARVLVVEGSRGEADTLVAALEAAGVGSEIVGVADIPDVNELVTFAGIVLADVDARTLTGTQIDTLTTAVRDLGRGLVTIGGTQSYGVGGYRESPLSDLLPVDSEILDPQRRRTVAEVLSIDTSESMSACHCDGDDLSGQIVQGGVNKTDISRAAAERTISALAATDEIGVLAWNSTAEWVVPLQRLPAADVVEEGLRSLRPAGSTNIRDSLGDAAEALLASDAELKHIILFSDGFTDVNLIADTADEAGRLFEEHGITTSVLATGEGAAPSLEDIAVAGNGRFYAGTDLEAVPEIMAEEAVIASRDFVNEGEFLPEVTSEDAVVAGLVESPPLFGYIATSAKSQAATLLRIGPDRDPLLATWQAGLGRVTSWTSDVNSWSVGWSGWDGFVDFWGRVVKDTLPSGDDAGAVQATVRDGRISVSVESADAFPDGATVEARVSGPDGQADTVTLERTAATRFEGTAEAPRPGSYAVSATARDRAGAPVLSSSTLASNSYPAEYVPGPADEALLARLADATNGRVGVTVDGVWDPMGLARGSHLVRLLGPLLLAAALLWPVAVVLSRVTLRGTTLAGVTRGASAGVARAGRRARRSLPRIGGLDPDAVPNPRAAGRRADVLRVPESPGAPPGAPHVGTSPDQAAPPGPAAPTGPAAPPGQAIPPGQAASQEVSPWARPPSPPHSPSATPSSPPPAPPATTPPRPATPTAKPPAPPAVPNPPGPPPTGRTVDDLLAAKRARRSGSKPDR